MSALSGPFATDLAEFGFELELECLHQREAARVPTFARSLGLGLGLGPGCDEMEAEAEAAAGLRADTYMATAEALELQLERELQEDVDFAAAAAAERGSWWHADLGRSLTGCMARPHFDLSDVLSPGLWRSVEGPAGDLLPPAPAPPPGADATAPPGAQLAGRVARYRRAAARALKGTQLRAAQPARQGAAAEPVPPRPKRKGPGPGPGPGAGWGQASPPPAAKRGPAACGLGLPWALAPCTARRLQAPGEEDPWH
jgi:hypothetical protein